MPHLIMNYYRWPMHYIQSIKSNCIWKSFDSGRYIPTTYYTIVIVLFSNWVVIDLWHLIILCYVGIMTHLGRGCRFGNGVSILLLAQGKYFVTWLNTFSNIVLNALSLRNLIKYISFIEKHRKILLSMVYVFNFTTNKLII